MQEKFKTLVFGASLKPYRYSHRAINALSLNGYEVVALGLREGDIGDVKINTGQPELEGIHTITMYVNASRQVDSYEYLLSLKPKRIIFNPGAENPAFTKIAREQNIHCENACTLVLLSIGEYESTPV